ncbi:hypothetical protein [Clostridium butyricum]|uniref:hypothetical protein n=1 Tax=Clostridium butyricum TaxID=1492 RepID=UPI00290E8005|nr:hypothetical protein [Clostridium butyricum]MDU3584436.1 hypothetical protein [Clostridium butyricum]MDU3597734.1 hypothetical protein [Clostridium butyricum]
MNVAKIFELFLKDIGEKELKKIDYIVMILIGLFSPTVIILYLFKPELVKQYDIFKIILICMTINIIAFYMLSLALNATENIKLEIIKRKKKSYDGKIKEKLKQYRQINSNNTEKQEIFKKIKKLYIKRKPLIEIIKLKNLIYIRKNSFINASIINMIIGLITIGAKIYILYDNNFTFRQMCIVVSVVYIFIWMLFFFHAFRYSFIEILYETKLNYILVEFIGNIIAIVIFILFLKETVNLIMDIF